MRALLPALALLFLMAAAHADPQIDPDAQPSLLQNGGFESGSFSGWSLTGNTNYSQVFNQDWDGLYPRGGHDYALLGPQGTDGILSQSFADIPGDILTVSFWLSSDGGAPSDFSAALDGATFTQLSDAGAFGWIRFSATFIATGSDTVQFRFRDDTDYFALDRVHVIQLPPTAPVADIPEPPVTALFACAVLVLGAFRRRLPPP